MIGRSQGVRRFAAVLPLGALVVALFVAAPARAAAAPPADGDLLAQHVRGGERVAEAITVATGVPISPLLGVSGLLAWRWWSTPEALRSRLPWYVHPALWGTGLALALLFGLNTTIAGLVPGLKKPLDFVEHYENLVSALLASPIVVVEVQRILAGLPAMTAQLAPAALAPAAALASAPAAVLQALGSFGSALLTLAIYATVFVAFHAIQVLIALSPSALLDLLLRGFRFGFLLLVALAADVHPYVGAAFALLVLGVATLVAGWAFRVSVLGFVFAGDLVYGGRSAEASGGVRAFAGRALAAAPARSYGRLERSAEGVLRFIWRPWLLGPRRRIDLPAESAVALRRGALSPTLFLVGGVREPAVARLPPRYKRREEEVAARLGAVEIRDGRLVRGLRATWRWLRDLVLGDETAEAAAR